MRVLFFNKEGLTAKDWSSAYGHEHAIWKYYKWETLKQNWPYLILTLFNKCLIIGP